MNKAQLPSLSLTTLTLALAACGGGGSSGTASAPPSTDPNVVAATTTAQTNAKCTALTGFYWEIGNVSGKLASGTGGGGSAPTATTPLSIASASKWLYGAYVTEQRGAAGVNAVTDVPFLNFTSGYSNFGVPACPAASTVDDCLAGRNSINATEAANGQFHYDSGHMQQHASDTGLGAMTDSTLATAINGSLGIHIVYSEPQLAGGVVSDASNYAAFLRRLLVGSSSPLRIASVLGTHAVCTLPGSAGCNAVFSPTTNDWHYSLGHWVEDDAALTAAHNTAYSSAGAFGFYPWVSSDRTLYGLIAREDRSGGQQGFLSSSCGAAVRQAYVTGVAQ